MVAIATSQEAKRLQCLIRHIEDVRQDCQLLGTRLIERGDLDLGRTLIANGFAHDHSKFDGVEWEHLHSRSDPLFAEAWEHHIKNNSHHPEYWGSIHRMPPVAVAEMTCDWHARAAELDGGGLRWWIDHEATSRFGFSWGDEVGRMVADYVDLLLEHWN
jgi:hypothetical protein